MSTIVIEKEIYEMSAAELERFPVGVIAVDKSGTILSYNAAEEVLGRRKAETAIGLNFFRDVAPCTAVREFQGRFADFVEQGDILCEEFRFVFRFAWGDREVGITFVRRPDEPQIYIVANAYGVEIVVQRKSEAI